METLDCKKCAYYAPKRDFGYRVVSATCLKHDQLPISQAKKKCDGKEFVSNYANVHYTPYDRGIAMKIIEHLKRVESDYGIDLTTEISWLMDKVKINK